MVIPDPPLSRKQDKDVLVPIASTHAPTPSQGFSQFKGCSSSVTSQGDSASPDQGFNDIVPNTEPSHLSNLVLFAKNKTPSESVWKYKYSGYSKVRTDSQSSSNCCPRKYVRNKNLKFDVKYGIACAIPELYDEDTYSGQDSDYSYSASCYDTPVSYSNHNISLGVNDSLSSSRYKTSNFPLISVGKGLHHQVGEGQGAQLSQAVYTQGLPESSSVTSSSSKKRWKNKNSKLRKEAFSASRTDWKPFFCLYGKIVHTDDCKCLKINLWKRCLLPGCHPDKVGNSDTTTFGNVYQNNLDEDVYDNDKQVSSLSKEINADTDIAVSGPKSVTRSIHSDQSCTTKLVCESAKKTDNQLIEYGSGTDLGTGEEITQQYNSATADLRVFSPETADTVLPLIHQTPNYSSREESQSLFLSESESLKVEHFRHTYDSVKNFPLQSDTSANLTAGLKVTVQQVNEPSQFNALRAETEGLTRSLYNLIDVVQYTQTKSNIKASERPATKNDLASCLALFDNLLIDIDDQLEGQGSYTGESSIGEQFGLDPWAALSSQSTAKMASQGKKNKNQFVRKAAPASPVNGSGGSSLHVTSIEMRLAEVSIDCASHSTSQKDMNVTNKIELTQGSPPEFGLEQHGIPSDAGVGDAPHILRQRYDLGDISTPSSVNIQYSEQSSSVPTIHSHLYSSPNSNTGSSSQSAYPDSTGNNGTASLDKTQSPVPPAKPPRTFKSETMGQITPSSIHKEAQLGSAQFLGGICGNAKQHSSSRLQGSQQFDNNFDDDGQGYLGQRQASDNPLTASDDGQGYLGQRQASDIPLTASDEDIQFEYLEEQARMQYEGPEINNGQKGNSHQSTLLQTRVGQNLPFYMNEQELNQFPSSSLSNKTQYSSKEHKQIGQHEGMIPRLPDAGKMGQTSSSQLDYWMDETQSVQNSGQMEQQQSWQHRRSLGGGQQEGLQQMPGTEHGRLMQPVQRGLQDRMVGLMHPHAQLNAMQLNEQGFKENVQGVQSQQGSVAQDGHFPTDRRHGDDQSSDTYCRGEGVSDYTGKSTYITERELAQEQLDQRMNNPWFQEMVKNMKELVEREGLIVKDVFPDGNCLFTAVVDQLRVRGNFKYTPSTLRAAAVNYLIENSKQRDGTPLEHFLSNETWDHYLGRMSRDGEWGEHIILGAISEVLCCRINVLGGISGKSCTVVQPQHMSDKEEEEREKKRMETKGSKTTSDSQTVGTAKSDNSPSQDENNSETSQSKTGSKSASPQTGEQSKSLQTGSASLPKQTDATAESTDTSQRKDQNAFRSKRNWDKENEELSQGEELYIGLLGEMHYVSLRKKDWEESLHEKLWARIKKREAQRKGRSEEGSSSDDDMCLPEDPAILLQEDTILDPVSGLPLPHLDFLYQDVRNSPFVSLPSGSHRKPGSMRQMVMDDIGFYEAASEISFTENILDPFSTTSLPHFSYLLEKIAYCIIASPTTKQITLSATVRKGSVVEVVGFDAELLEPYALQMPPRSRVADALVSSNPTKRTPCITVFYTPTDTVVHRKDFEREHNDVDLIMDTSHCVPGFVKLVPVMTELWPCETDERGRKMYLPHLTYVQSKGSLHNREDTKVSIATNTCIAFRAYWPEEANEWIVRTRPHNWPSKKVRRLIVQNGCRIIPQDSHTSRLEWKIDFGLSEGILLRQAVSIDQQMGYRIWKLFFGDMPCHYQSKLTDVTRNVFFYACEFIPPASWKEKIGMCILHMIADLLLKIEQKMISHYFMNSVNLFDQLPEDCVLHLKKKIQSMRASPLISAYFSLDILGISSEGPKSWIEVMFEDLRLFALDGNIVRSYRNVFLPSKLEAVRTMTELGNYPQAADYCMSVFVLLTRIEPDTTFPDFFQFMLTDIHPILKWCLAFYFDTFYGMSLLDAVCSITETVSLSEILGPLTTLNLRSGRVPLEYTQGANVLFFVDCFSFCLERMCYHKDNIAVICTFIRRYYVESTKKYAFDDSLKGTAVDKTPYPRHLVIYQTMDELINCKLYEIYSRLYNAFCAIERPREFQYYMNLFEEVCDRYCKESAYQFLAELWSWYNDQTRADIAWIKCQSLRKGTKPLYSEHSLIRL